MLHKQKMGFTGTRGGMTNRQKKAFMILLENLDPTEFHHGDCIGADANAHLIADAHAVPIIIHPPEDSKQRAYCLANTPRIMILNPKPYLERNHDIVDQTDYLVATPRETKEELRSGTWATIRYARKVNKQVIIIYTDGTVINHETI